MAVDSPNLLCSAGVRDTLPCALGYMLWREMMDLYLWSLGCCLASSWYVVRSVKFGH